MTAAADPTAVHAGAGRALGGRVITAACGAWAAVAATDAATLFLFPFGEAGCGDRLKAAWVSSAWCFAAAAPVGALWACVGTAGLALARRGVAGRLAAPLPAAATFGVALAAFGTATMSGQGVARSSTLVQIRDALPWAVPLAVYCGLMIATPLVRAVGRRRGGVAAGVVAALLFVVLAGVFDRMVHPERYASAHAAARLTAASAGAAAALIVLRPPRTRVAGAAFASAAVLALAAVPAPPLASAPVARCAAFRDTILLKLALQYLAPPPPRPAPDATALADFAREGGAADAASLDRVLPRRRAMNLVWISIDTLREDRLDRVRSEGPVMPRLSAYARHAARFKAMWTPLPATSHALAATFSGLWPSATDVVQAGVAEGRNLETRTQPILARALRDAGFRTEATAGFDPDGIRLWFPHTKNGFEAFNLDAKFARDSLPAAEVAASALAALDRTQGRRFFLWMHFFNPHAPYDPAVRRFGRAKEDRYDAEVYDCDEAAGRFLDGLAARGLAADTIVVLFSDHGEEFGLKGRTYHATALSEGQIRVPCFIYVPGLPGRVVERPASLIDLTPTMLDLLDVPRFPTHGRSLAADLLGLPDAGDSPPVFAELCDPLPGIKVRQFALRRGDLKFVRDESAGADELYDVRADPEERVNLIERRPEDAARMAAWLEAARVRSLLPPAGAESRPR